jgi:hypothetical protein
MTRAYEEYTRLVELIELAPDEQDYRDIHRQLNDLWPQLTPEERAVLAEELKFYDPT